MLMIRSFVFFYIFLGFLLQILGDFKLNRYVRFYGGVIVLLLLMSPIYELVTKEDVSLNVDFSGMWQEYQQAREFEAWFEGYSETYQDKSIEILLEDMEARLHSYGYKIHDYKAEKSPNQELENLCLYLVPMGNMGIPGTMDSSSENAVWLKEWLQSIYEPDFLLEVYCSE